jgi:hypothetical protein
MKPRLGKTHQDSLQRDRISATLWLIREKGILRISSEICPQSPRQMSIVSTRLPNYLGPWDRVFWYTTISGKSDKLCDLDLCVFWYSNLSDQIVSKSEELPRICDQVLQIRTAAYHHKQLPQFSSMSLVTSASWSCYSTSIFLHLVLSCLHWLRYQLHRI